MPYGLGDEILGHLRTDDDLESGAAIQDITLPKPGPGEPADPFGELFEYQPRTGRSHQLTKRLETEQLVDAVLGAGTVDLFAAPAESPLEKRLEAISQKAANRLEKAVKVALGAPARKQRIGEILAVAKRRLSKYADVPECWDRLQASCEKFLSEALLSI